MLNIDWLYQNVYILTQPLPYEPDATQCEYFSEFNKFEFRVFF